MKRLIIIIPVLFCFFSYSQQGRKAGRKNLYGTYQFFDSVYFQKAAYNSGAGIVHLGIDTVASSPTFGKLVRKTAGGATPTLQQVFDAQTGEALMNKADTINLAANKMSVTNGKFKVDSLLVQDIYDTSGRRALKFLSNPSAVNYVRIENGSTGGACSITLDGETNINFFLQPKGTGKMFLAGTTAQEAYLGFGEDQDNGNDYSFIRSPAALTGDRNITLPDLSGVMALNTQGADVASTAGAMTLGTDGNVFEITGTNTITLILNTSRSNGAEITLIFTSTATLTDGTANSGTSIGMELASNTNFVASADDVITLVLCEIGGVQRWREKSRSVN